MSWQDKVRDVRLQIQKKNVTAVVLQALDEIACKSNNINTNSPGPIEQVAAKYIAVKNLTGDIE